MWTQFRAGNLTRAFRDVLLLGRRDDATCRQLIDKVGVAGKTFVTDDWEGYHRVIP